MIVKSFARVPEKQSVEPTGEFKNNNSLQKIPNEVSRAPPGKQYIQGNTSSQEFIINL